MTRERAYPEELAARVRASWPADALPLPERLEAVLDVAYHASFLRDEERTVTFRVMVLPPTALPRGKGPPTALLPLPFTTRRQYDEQELRRLSPAAQVSRALIGVDEVGGQPGIWGIVQSGPRWLQAAQGGRAKEPPMPPCLVLRTTRPGHVIVSVGNHMVGELRGGQLSDFSLDVFQSRWLPALFADAREELLGEHRAMSPQSSFSDPAAAALGGHLAQQMLKRVIATMRGAHHGGTLIVAAPSCLPHLQTNYVFREGDEHRRFRMLAVKMLDVVSATWRESNEPDGGPPRSVDHYRLLVDPRLGELDEGLFEVSHLLAALASVDGAVVLTKRFDVLGFGAEIAGSLPNVRTVQRALDLEADTCTTEVVDSVGTRHRSAYRFCAAVQGAVAIVVSQDGGVRFVTNHHGKVTYWDHGPGD